MSIDPEVIKELQRKVEKTGKLRFMASTRFMMQYKISQWAISLLSVILIIVPLLQALGAFGSAKPQVLNVIQVALAVVILVFSLLIGMDNYAVRAERMHSCGLELADLARQMTCLLGDVTKDEYQKWNEKYHGILKGYENHSELDFKRLTLQDSKWYYPQLYQYIFAYVTISLRYLMSFFPYLLLAAIFIVTIMIAFKFQ